MFLVLFFLTYIKVVTWCLFQFSRCTAASAAGCRLGRLCCDPWGLWEWTRVRVLCSAAGLRAGCRCAGDCDWAVEARVWDGAVAGDRCRPASVGTLGVVGVHARRSSALRRCRSDVRGGRQCHGDRVRRVVEARSLLQVPSGAEFSTPAAPAAPRRRLHRADGPGTSWTFPAQARHLRLGCCCHVGGLCLACVPQPPHLILSWLYILLTVITPTTAVKCFFDETSVTILSVYSL